MDVYARTHACIIVFSLSVHTQDAVFANTPPSGSAVPAALGRGKKRALNFKFKAPDVAENVALADCMKDKKEPGVYAGMIRVL